MKKMIMAALVLVLLVGGGAGAYFTLLAKPAEAATGEDATEHVEVEEEHDDTHYEFVELDPLILPIVGDDGVSQTVSLVVVLEVMDSDAVYHVEAMTPRIQDAFIQDLYGALNRHAALKGGVIQVDYLKQRLNKISQEVIGEDQVHDVLLQVVQQRRI